MSHFNKYQTGLFLLLCLTLSTTIAQKQNFTKGKITMGVEKILLNGEEAPTQMGASLGDIKLEIFSNGEKQKTVFTMMMMKTVNFYSNKSDSVKMYMDVMGKKYLIADSKKNLNTSSSINNPDVPIEIKEYREDVKDILGFKCYRVDVKMKVPEETTALEGLGDLDLKLYVTDQLHFDVSYITNGKQSIDLKATPLEYNMRMGSSGFAMEMIMLAKEFSKEISESDFDLPQGNFKIYSMEEFQQEMGQMKR